MSNQINLNDLEDLKPLKNQDLDTVEFKPKFKEV